MIEMSEKRRLALYEKIEEKRGRVDALTPGRNRQ